MSYKLSALFSRSFSAFNIASVCIVWAECPTWLFLWSSFAYCFCKYVKGTFLLSLSFLDSPKFCAKSVFMMIFPYDRSFKAITVA